MRAWPHVVTARDLLCVSLRVVTKVTEWTSWGDEKTRTHGMTTTCPKMCYLFITRVAILTKMWKVHVSSDKISFETTLITFSDFNQLQWHADYWHKHDKAYTKMKTTQSDTTTESSRSHSCVSALDLNRNWFIQSHTTTTQKHIQKRGSLDSLDSVFGFNVRLYSLMLLCLLNDKRRRKKKWKMRWDETREMLRFRAKWTDKMPLRSRFSRRNGQERWGRKKTDCTRRSQSSQIHHLSLHWLQIQDWPRLSFGRQVCQRLLCGFAVDRYAFTMGMYFTVGHTH